MSGVLDQVRAMPSGTDSGLHSLKRTGRVVDSPVALTGDKTGRNIDRAAGKGFKLGSVLASRAPIPLQTALKTGPIPFGCVHGQLLVRKPLATSNLGRGRHFRRHCFRHALVEIHNVVSRHLGELTRRVEVEPDDVPELLFKALVVGQLEGARQMRLDVTGR